MKLITEQFEDLNYIFESNDQGQKDMFIEGIFLQSDLKNRNGRVYPKRIMEKEVTRYMKESVARRNAFGELGHPSGPTINPDRISHLITDLREDGPNYIGKAKILPTPMGNIARNIMEAGGKLAVSSRGVGSLKRNGDRMEVQEDFQLSTAADIVINPSAPDAYVDAIMETPDWVYNTITKEWELKQLIDEAKQFTKAKLDESLILEHFKKLSTILTENARPLIKDDDKPDNKWKKVKVLLSLDDGHGKETRSYLTGGNSRAEVHEKIKRQYRDYDWKVIDYEFNPRELRSK